MMVNRRYTKPTKIFFLERSNKSSQKYNKINGIFLPSFSFQTIYQGCFYDLQGSTALTIC